MGKSNPNVSLVYYFLSADNPLHKQYLALRMFFVDQLTADPIASKFGYTTATVYSLIRDFKKRFETCSDDPFFKETQMGRPKLDHGGEINKLVVAYRKKYCSYSVLPPMI